MARPRVLVVCDGDKEIQDFLRLSGVAGYETQLTVAGGTHHKAQVLNDARVEPALATSNLAEPVQFERLGYFARDKDAAPGRRVFNRTVGLRDSYAKAGEK